jgi:biopolymer transport protein ExbB
MIEVFDVMALTGNGNTRGMAGGVSKATLPTMAGMVAAISGMLFSVQLDQFADGQSARVEDKLDIIHERD